MLLREVEDDVWLSRDTQDMNPNEVVKDPPCSRVRNTLPFLIWEGRSMLFEGRANAVIITGQNVSQYHR